MEENPVLQETADDNNNNNTGENGEDEKGTENENENLTENNNNTEKTENVNEDINEIQSDEATGNEESVDPNETQIEKTSEPQTGNADVQTKSTSSSKQSSASAKPNIVENVQKEQSQEQPNQVIQNQTKVENGRYNADGSIVNLMALPLLKTNEILSSNMALASLAREKNYNTTPRQSFWDVREEDEEYDDDDVDVPLSRRIISETLPLSEIPELVELANLIRIESQTKLLEEATAKQALENDLAADLIKKSMAELAKSSLAGGKAASINESIMSVAQQQQPKINREELINKFQVVLERRDKAKIKSLQLQQKLGEYLKRKRPDEGKDTDKNTADWEQRYATSLNALKDLRDQIQEINLNNENVVFSMKQQMEAKNLDAECLVMDFNKLRKTTLTTSENSRTGKSIPSKMVDVLEQADMKKEQEISQVRLENIKLRNKIRRQEMLLRQKEELGDGLHLIDFEQLKIENQSHNEKIEERNEELLKLRKKITNIVQMLTHVKEKLYFMEIENGELKGQLADLDHNVTKRRDDLPSLKIRRDSLRSGNTLIRQKNGLLGNYDLLYDFESKRTACEVLQVEVDDLKSLYHNLVQTSNEIKRQIQKIRLKHRIESLAIE